MRILLIDYSTDRSEGAAVSRWLPAETVHVHVPGEGPFPDPAGYSHVLHSGSAWSICSDAPFQDDAEALVRRAAELGRPQMGICYGHQMLARALLGREAVRRNPGGCEAGWLEVRWSPYAARLAGIPRVTRVFQFHYDEVIVLPRGSMILAWNAACLVQSFVCPGLRLFGTQFHPEFDRASGNAQYLRERAKLASAGLDADSIIAGGPEPDADGSFFRFFLGLDWEGSMR